MAAFGNLTQQLDSRGSLVIGLYLLLSGLFIEGINLLALVCYIRFSSLRRSPSVIPEVSLLICHLGVVILHPFSGIAAMIEKWPWGQATCQLYGLFDFFLRNFQSQIVAFLAFDRYILVSQADSLSTFRTIRIYVYLILTITLFAAFWAIMPLIGWGNYSFTPIQIVCSLDWYRTDFGYFSFVLLSTCSVYFLPIYISVHFYKQMWRFIKQAEPIQLPRCMTKSKLVLIGSCLSVYLCLIPYNVVSFWPIIISPTYIPTWLNALPPPMAKAAGIFNTIFYVQYNPKVWNCIKKMIGFQYDQTAVDDDGPDVVEVEETIAFNAERRQTVEEQMMIQNILRPTSQGTAV